MLAWRIKIIPIIFNFTLMLKINRNWLIYQQFKSFCLDHKKISLIGVIGLVAVIWLTYTFAWSSADEITYNLSTVSQGSIVSVVSGTGQISASNQVDLTSKVSAEVVKVYAKVGQEMRAGELIVQLDTSDALVDLETAKISYQKLVKPADKLSITQAENSLKQAETEQIKTYQDGLDDVASAFVDLPDILSGLNDVFYFSDYFAEHKLSDTALTYRKNASRQYHLAKNQYEEVWKLYQQIDRTNVDYAKTETLIEKSCEVSKNLAQAVKDTILAVDFVVKNGDHQQVTSEMTSDQDELNSLLTKVNNHLTNLNSALNSIDSAERGLVEKQESLAELKAGADELDIRSQLLSWQQKEKAYQQYFITAPFDGVLASLEVNESDDASGSIGTFITKQKIAEITLSEIDIAKVALGQRATLSFDAFTDLMIVGQVVEVDLIGTVNQGVVTYTVKIAFTDDERIKTGMSVSADIVTEAKDNVLLVPNSAVKSQDDVYYVETFADDNLLKKSQVSTTIKPISKKITVGLNDDDNTEIISGLSVGDKIIVKTTTTNNTSSGNTSKASSGNNRGSQSIFGGGPGMVGGVMR